MTNKIPYRIILVMIYVLLFITFQKYFDGWIKLVGSLIMFGGIFWAGFKDAEDFEKEEGTKGNKDDK